MASGNPVSIDTESGDVRIYGQDLLIGQNTQYAGYTMYGSNLSTPSIDGRINGVSITALNKRTRVSNAAARDCVSTWTARTSATDNNWFSVCWAPELSLFVAVAGSGAGNRVMTSSDGINWITRTSAVDNSWSSVCWAAELSLFVAVAEGAGTGNRVMTSPDGITWTSRTSAEDSIWRSVCWAPEISLFVAVAISGTRVMTSPNGITWTARTPSTNNNWSSVCWAPELALFVAVAGSGDGNRVMTSPDGITWTTRTSAADNVWRSLCWAPELSLFVAVADTGTGNRVMTSPDGIVWTSRTSAADNSWGSVCWAPQLSLFVAVSVTGTGNRVMTSPDGISWTTRTYPVDNDWRSVCWAPELSMFVVVGSSGTGNRVMTSAIGMPNAKSVVKALPSQMMVDARGNVGIGTIAPLQPLHVQGSSYVSGNIGIGTTIPFSGAVGRLYTTDSIIMGGGSYIGANMYYNTNTGLWTRYNTASGGFAFRIGSSTDYAGDSFQLFTINTAGTVNQGCMAVNNGNVGIGTSNPQQQLHITASMRLGAFAAGTGAAVYRNATSGDIVGTSSDIRLKSNVREIPNALAKTNSLRGVLFNWTNENDPDFNIDQESTQDQMGMIAQEVEQVCPELVCLNGVKDYKTIRYAETTALLIEAVKELTSKVTALEQKVTQLSQ